MLLNTRRATPERALILFVAFALLAAVSAVRDCRRRHQLEQAVPATADRAGSPNHVVHPPQMTVARASRLQ